MGIGWGELSRLGLSRGDLMQAASGTGKFCCLGSAVPAIRRLGMSNHAAHALANRMVANGDRPDERPDTRTWNY